MHIFLSGPSIIVDLSFNGPRLGRISLSLGTRFSCRWEGTKDRPEAILAWLEAYSQKQPLSPEKLLDLEGLPPFHQKTLEFLQRIPFGDTASYGEVAEAIGNPRAARAVGNACNRNPYPLLIPCHRVIASNGGLGGFAIDLKIKERLLAFED